MTPEVQRHIDEILADLGAIFDAAREAQGLTVVEFAARAALSKRAVVHSRKTEGDPRLSTLIKLSRAVGRRLVVRCE